MQEYQWLWHGFDNLQNGHVQGDPEKLDTQQMLNSLSGTEKVFLLCRM